MSKNAKGVYIHHFLEGETWPIKTKKNSTVTVTMGPHGLWCECTYFNFMSRCNHCDAVVDLIEGKGMPNWAIPE